MDAKTMDSKILSDEIILLELRMQSYNGRLADHMIEVRSLQNCIKNYEEEKERLEKQLNKLKEEQ